jgi:hypothetical protein
LFSPSNHNGFNGLSIIGFRMDRKREKCRGSRFSNAPQNAAAQLLYKIVGGVIPQSDKEQGMDV